MIKLWVFYRSMWTPKGNYISSLAEACSSTLTYSVNLVKSGLVEFEYQFPSSAETMFHFIVSTHVLKDHHWYYP